MILHPDLREHLLSQASLCLLTNMVFTLVYTLRPFWTSSGLEASKEIAALYIQGEYRLGMHVVCKGIHIQTFRELVRTSSP